MPLNNSTQESHTNENYNAETNSKQLKFSFLSLRLNKFSVSLLGFSLLLFVIATNTQSGWLFILISLLLSSLLVDGLQALITVMRAIDTLKLSISPTYENSDLTWAVNGGYVGDYDCVYSFTLRLDNQSSKDFSNIRIQLVAAANSPISYAWNKEQSLILDLQPDQEVIEPSPTTIRILSNLYSLKNKSEIEQLYERLKQEGQTSSLAERNSFQAEQIVLLDTVGANKATKLNYKIRIKRRGIYSAAPSSLTFYSYLGLVNFTLTVDPDICRLYIAPEALDMQPAQPLTKTNSNSSTYVPLKSLSETENFYGMHEFQIGENIRHIHWTTSARMDNLMIKEFQIDPPQKKKVPLLLSILATTNDKVDIAQASCALEMALVFTNTLARLCKKEKRELHIFFITNKAQTIIYENSELSSYPLRQFLAEASLTTPLKYNASIPPQEMFSYAREQFIKHYKKAFVFNIALHPYLDPQEPQNEVSAFLLMQPPNTDAQTSEDFAATALRLKRKSYVVKCVTIQDDPIAVLGKCFFVDATTQYRCTNLGRFRSYST